VTAAVASAETPIAPSRSRGRRAIAIGGWLAIAVVAVWFWPSRLGGATTVLVVQGDSMLPTHHSGDLVIARSRARYERGDVIVFAIRPSGSSTATTRVMHRIVAIGDDGSIVTQGDNRSNPDSFETTAADVIGEARWAVPRGGVALWLFSRWWFLGAVGGALIALRLLQVSGDEVGVAKDARDELAGHAPHAGDLAEAAALAGEGAEHLDAGETACFFESRERSGHVVALDRGAGVLDDRA